MILSQDQALLPTDKAEAAKMSEGPSRNVFTQDRIATFIGDFFNFPPKRKSV